MPPSDLGTSQVTIELPPGVRIEDTARVSAQVAALVRQSPDVADIVEAVGDGDDGSIRNATVYISLKPLGERKLSFQREWEDQLAPKLRQIADARISVASQDGGGDSPVSLYFTGDDLEVLDGAARAAVAEMRMVKELRDPRIKGDLPRPELLIRPRFDLAAQLGVTVQAISQTIKIATLGDIPQNAAKFNLADRQVAIRVSLPPVLARGPVDAREPAGANHLRRRGAVEGGRRDQLRRRARRDPPLQPDPSDHGAGRPAAKSGAR